MFEHTLTYLTVGPGLNTYRQACRACKRRLQIHQSCNPPKVRLVYFIDKEGFAPTAQDGSLYTQDGMTFELALVAVVVADVDVAFPLACPCTTAAIKAANQNTNIS